MTHYWGAPAICQRLGFGSPKRLPDLVHRYHVPVWKQLTPRKRRRSWFTTEAMIQTWELSRATEEREKLVAAREAGLDQRYKAPVPKRGKAQRAQQPDR